MSNDPFTLALHADEALPDGVDIAPPIHVATTYDRSTQGDLVYRRERHLTTERLEAVIGALEGGSAVAYASGMAAVAGVLRHLRPRRIALPFDVYHGVRNLVTQEVAEGRWDVVASDLLEAGDVWWVETPSNPRLEIIDIEATVASARERGVVVVVDSTFASPVLQRPLALGADVVIHSATKVIAGHSDALGGVAVVGDVGTAQALRERRGRDGAIPGSLDAWLTLRGARTLPLRIERQSTTSLTLARHLFDRVPVVWYPWLSTHPGHAIAVRQMSAGGGVVSLELDDDAAAEALVGELRLFRHATSLGGVESLAEWRRSVDPRSPQGLVRLSIGLESPADLIADIDQALEQSG